MSFKVWIWKSSIILLDRQNDITDRFQKIVKTRCLKSIIYETPLRIILKTTHATLHFHQWSVAFGDITNFFRNCVTSLSPCATKKMTFNLFSTVRCHSTIKTGIQNDEALHSEKSFSLFFCRYRKYLRFEFKIIWYDNAFLQKLRDTSSLHATKKMTFNLFSKGL